MKQYIKTFWDNLGVIEKELNDFLNEHPDYEIYKVTMTQNNDTTFVKVLVVFKINSITQTYAVARGVTE